MKATEWIALGILVLALGFWLYSITAPQRQQAQSFLGQVAVAFDPKVASQVGDLQKRYYGSIALMVTGAVSLLYGLASIAGGSSQK